MPLLPALLVAASCAWTTPGADRFTGDPVAAVDHYTDIPVETRMMLKDMIAKKNYSAVVEITRDQIGGGSYADLRDMHFGANKLCHAVNRSKWKPAEVERGLVFCAGGQCLILPTACGNLSRVTPTAKPKKATGGAGGGDGALVPIEPVASGGPGGGIAPPPIEVAPMQAPSFVTASAAPAPGAVTSGGSEVSAGGSGGGSFTPMPFPSFGGGGGGYIPSIPSPPCPALPEPSTWLMLALGAVCVVIIAKRNGRPR